jgi:hypothetical protein
MSDNLIFQMRKASKSGLGLLILTVFVVGALFLLSNPAYAGNSHDTLIGWNVPHQTTSSNWTLRYDPPIERLSAVAVFNSFLYIAGADQQRNGRIYRFDGTTWTDLNIADAIGIAVEGIESLEVFNNRLYIGGRVEISGSRYASVYSYDGTIFTQEFLRPGQDGYAGIIDLAIHDNTLFAANGTPVGEVYQRINDSNWVIAGGVIEAGSYVAAITSYQGNLYAGCGTKVWRLNGTNWVFEKDLNWGIARFVTLNNDLYAGMTSSGPTVELYKFDGVNWTIDKLFAGSGLILDGVDDKLWASTDKDVYRLEGTTWISLGNPDNSYITGLEPYNGGVYGVTSNGSVYSIAGETTFTIAGKVMIDGLTGVAGVTISDGIGHSTTTDQNGNYMLSSLSAGSYTVTPSKSGYIFKPTSLTVNLGPDANGKDFLAQPVSSSISLQADPGYDRIQLAWNISNDPMVSGYRIWRASPTLTDTFSIITTTAELHYYDMENMTNGVGYCYKVEALNNENVVDKSNVACATLGEMNMWVPDTYTSADQTVIVPINIRNATGLSIASADIWLDFDPAILECLVVSNTAMTTNFAWNSNRNNIQGRVKISTIASPPKAVFGDGSLFWLTFHVKGAPDSSSKLDLLNFIALTGGSTIQTEEGGKLVNVPLSLTDGTLFVQSKGMLGDVDDNGVVAAADAYLALQMTVGKQEPTAKQMYAADVNGDGAVSSADVSMILYYAVNNNWPLPPSGSQLLSTADNTTVLKLDDVTGATPGSIVQVVLRGIGLKDWAGGDWVIAYDKNTIIQIISVTAAQLSGTSPFMYNDDGKGKLRISVANSTMTSGDGSIFLITMKLANVISKSDTLLAIASANLNDQYGRDFVLSALQGNIERQNSVIRFSNRLFLPMVDR